MTLRNQASGSDGGPRRGSPGQGASLGNRRTNRNVGGNQTCKTRGKTMSTAAALIAISLFLLAGLGLAGLFLAGRESRAANADDPKPGG